MTGTIYYTEPRGYGYNEFQRKKEALDFARKAARELDEDVFLNKQVGNITTWYTVTKQGDLIVNETGIKLWK